MIAKMKQNKEILLKSDNVDLWVDSKDEVWSRLFKKQKANPMPTNGLHHILTFGDNIKSQIHIHLLNLSIPWFKTNQ